MLRQITKNNERINGGEPAKLHDGTFETLAKLLRNFG
jgi:hypothetical protein